jgi:hypothetical protein
MDDKNSITFCKSSLLSFSSCVSHGNCINILLSLSRAPVKIIHLSLKSGLKLRTVSIFVIYGFYIIFQRELTIKKRS